MHFHITLRELPDIIQPYDVTLTDLIGQLIEKREPQLLKLLVLQLQGKTIGTEIIISLLRTDHYWKAAISLSALNAICTLCSIDWTTLSLPLSYLVACHALYPYPRHYSHPSSPFSSPSAPP